MTPLASEALKVRLIGTESQFSLQSDYLGKSSNKSSNKDSQKYKRCQYQEVPAYLSTNLGAMMRANKNLADDIYKSTIKSNTSCKKYSQK